MQPVILTSASNDFRYLDRLDAIVALASASKCQEFYLDPVDNKLYGFYDESYSVLSIDIPFEVRSPLFFTSVMLLTTEAKVIISQVGDYFTVPEYPYFIFPANLRSDFMNGKIGFDTERYRFVNMDTGEDIMECLCTAMLVLSFMYPRYTDTIAAYRNRQMTLAPGFTIDEFQTNEVIQYIYSAKVSEGRKIITVQGPNGKNYCFYVFKALMGPLLKTDKLSITIQDDLFESNKFMLTFTVHRKKIKIAGVPDITSFEAKTSSFMINLA